MLKQVERLAPLRPNALCWHYLGPALLRPQRSRTAPRRPVQVYYSMLVFGTIFVSIVVLSAVQYQSCWSYMDSSLGAMPVQVSLSWQSPTALSTVGQLGVHPGMKRGSVAPRAPAQ